MSANDLNKGPFLNWSVELLKIYKKKGENMFDRIPFLYRN